MVYKPMTVTKIGKEEMLGTKFLAFRKRQSRCEFPFVNQSEMEENRIRFMSEVARLSVFRRRAFLVPVWQPMPPEQYDLLLFQQQPVVGNIPRHT